MSATTLSESDSSLSSFSDFDVVMYTEAEVLEYGLLLVKFTSTRIARAKTQTNRTRFVEQFGVSVTVAVRVFHDLQTSIFDDACIPPDEVDLKFFLTTLYFLKNYPKEAQTEAIFDFSRKWVRDKIWLYARALQALKQEKILWPEFDDSEVWIISVDGVHCWIPEPEHPTWSIDRSYFSHKYNKAGMGYELGIHLWSSKLIWMNGPHKAGKPDVWVFENMGLREKLDEIGKKAIGDLGFRGHQAQVSVPNVNDSPKVKLFKSRASMRHETFNGMIKEFDCLKGRFRHSIEKFPICFEAVCVLCQYKMDTERPLFDILINTIFEDDEDSVAEEPLHDDGEGENDFNSDDEEVSDNDVQTY